jgi:hypothetical protein
MPKLHQRFHLVKEAEHDLRTFLVDLQAVRDITDLELLQMLTSYQLIIQRSLLREERHPDDPSKPADEE